MLDRARVVVVVVVMGALLAAGGCGGKQRTSSSDPGGSGGGGGGGGGGADSSGEAMVSPDTMDEIQRLFRRKGHAVSRCLAFAIDNQELPKSARGKITLAVTIARSGSVGEVSVIKASLESKSLSECVINKVKEIQFPEVPRPYETTYTYAFEAS